MPMDLNEADRINVDLDGTLTQGDRKFWEEEPKPDREMIDKINALYTQKRKTIIIWTARKWRHAEKTAAWLEKHGVNYHGLKMNKGGSDLYIDDKAINTERFKEDYVKD